MLCTIDILPIQRSVKMVTLSLILILMIILSEIRHFSWLTHYTRQVICTKERNKRFGVFIWILFNMRRIVVPLLRFGVRSVLRFLKEIHIGQRESGGLRIWEHISISYILKWMGMISSTHLTSKKVNITAKLLIFSWWIVSSSYQVQNIPKLLINFYTSTQAQAQEIHYTPNTAVQLVEPFQLTTHSTPLTINLPEIRKKLINKWRIILSLWVNLYRKSSGN